MNGQHDWEQLLAKYRFDLVISPVEWPLTSLLKRDPRWKVVEDNGKAIVLERVDRSAPERGQEKSGNEGSRVSHLIGGKG